MRLYKSISCDYLFVKEPGTKRFKGMVKWQRVEKFLFFFVKMGEPFYDWPTMFYEVNKNGEATR